MKHQPNDARDTLKNTYVKAFGRMKDAAKLLDMSPRSFKNHMDSLGMTTQDLIKHFAKNNGGVAIRHKEK